MKYLLGALIILVLLLIGALGFDFYHAMKSDYWIHDGGDHTYYTNTYEEKDGCVYFVNQYDDEIKQCGSYRISKQK